MSEMSAPRKLRVVVLGGLNMDLVVSTERMPAPGETVFGDSFRSAPGGKGGNQAVAAARLGADVRMVGRVGADEFGPALLENLRREGIDASRVATDPRNPTGVAMILLDARKQNYIVAAYGANLAADDSQIKAARDALAGADALLLQLETPLEVAIAAARAARENGALVIWDPAPAIDMGAEAYRLCDVLTPNQTEAEALTGVRASDRETAREAARRLVGMGASAAVVTMGDMGAHWETRDDVSGFVPAFDVPVADTVAAGDAFAAALGVAMSEGRDLPSAVRFASAAGALAVTRRGAQDAMPTRREVDALIRTGLLPAAVESASDDENADDKDAAR